MAQQFSLGEAMQALKSFYGDSFEGGFEDGQDMMTDTLRDKLHLSEHDAKQVVQALVKEKMVRWSGTVDSIPAAEGTAAGGPIVNGTWHL